MYIGQMLVKYVNNNGGGSRTYTATGCLVEALTEDGKYAILTSARVFAPPSENHSIKDAVFILRREGKSEKAG